MIDDNYDPRTTPWRIDEADFYEIENRVDQIKFLLRYAVLAPSGHNTQPWSFRITDEGVEVFADFDRSISVADPGHRELLMSVGAAIANLSVAAAHFGYEASVLYGASDQPVALVALRETSRPDASLSRLFPAITKRRTNRQPFEPREIEETALGTLCDFIDDNADSVRFIVPHDRGAVADLIEQGGRLLFSDPSFRGELASWVRPNEGSSRDGICGDALGIPGPLGALAPWMIRKFDISPAQSKRDREFAAGAAGLIVVTADDDRVSLLRAGQTVERLLLLLTRLGVNYSFLNEPIEVDSLRGQLWSLIRSAKPPQLLLRMGYARPVVKAMPRRPVEEVVR